MCGRFTLKTPAEAVARQFGLVAGEQLRLEFVPRFNIAPTQNTLAIRAERGDDGATRRTAARLRWGLIPAWAKDAKIASSLINARSETAAEKPSFRTALRKRRCLIPADGFYEWRREGAGKQAFYIARPDERPFALAGLWERWNSPEGPVETFTVLTTAANALMAGLHDRMPVILAPEKYDLWLDPELVDPAPLAGLFAPSPEELVIRPVGSWVNAPAHEGPRCLEPPEAAAPEPKPRRATKRSVATVRPAEPLPLFSDPAAEEAAKPSRKPAVRRRKSPGVE
jgi:putative SOS response-associated peptidase YedK